MATRSKTTRKKSIRATTTRQPLSSGIDELLLAALERGGDSLETGRYLVSFRDGALEEGVKSFKSESFRVADARDFKGQSVGIQDAGDADALVFPEIGVALVSGVALESSRFTLRAEGESDSESDPVEVIEPEYFAFAEGSEYLRGFLSAANAIASDFGEGGAGEQFGDDVEAEVLGATWGLRACKVPQSTRSGLRIKLAVLDTGMDLGHPHFSGRSFTTMSSVGQPVQDLHGHGTHCIGTACGPKSPPGQIARYGIGWGTRIFVGKVLSNSGSGSGASVLAGMNWAIANRCEVISMSLGSQSPVQAAYTNAGAAALRNGCLIVAAAGNAGPTGSTGAPANSPTIMSVASLDPNLAPSNFSNRGKIEIAGPGRDVFSSWPRPTLTKTISGTSMATPHVAGCAALWAQTSSALRGMLLWRKLQATARRLPYPASRVGAGLVQAP